LNRVIPPWYGQLFYDPQSASTDNPLLTNTAVQLFVNLNAKGLWTENGQEGQALQPDGSFQRAYLSGLCRRSTAKYLCDRLNRIPGFIAFWHRNFTYDCSIRQLWVTYDGNPFTQLVSSTNMLDVVANWAPELAASLSQDTEIVSFTCMQATVGNDLTRIVSDLLDRRYASKVPSAPPSTPMPAQPPTPMAPPPTPVRNDVKTQERASPSITLLDAGGQSLAPAPISYGRGQGFPWQFGDTLGDAGAYARCEATYGRGACEKWGAVIYPRCRHGYHPDGCCICTRSGGLENGWTHAVERRGGSSHLAKKKRK